MIACAQKIEGVPEVIKLLPLGHVHSRKGDFNVDTESFHAIKDWAQSRGIDIVIDYEHQTLDGAPAPAAGWIKELILEDGAICGRVEWTPKGAEYIKNGEYRYLSPVVLVRGTDSKVLRMPSAALTNIPAIDGMFPIVNSDTFDLDEGEDIMDFLKELAALLGLPEGATEADVTGAIKALADECKALKGNGKKPDEVVANSMVLSLLSLSDKATTADVTAEIAKLQNLCSQSTQKLAEQESTGLVEKALSEGKITPAQKQWATQYALSDRAGFAEFLSKATAIVPLGVLALSAKRRSASEFDSAVSEALGLSAADIEKYGRADA